MILQLIDEYKQQLRNGCNQTVCYKIFCKCELEDETIEVLSETFSWYGEAFLCKHMHKIFEQSLPDRKHSEHKNKFIDFFLYLSTKVFDSGRNRPKKSIENTHFGDGELVALYINEKKSLSFEIKEHCKLVALVNVFHIEISCIFFCIHSTVLFRCLWIFYK